MKKIRNEAFVNLRYFCIIFVIAYVLIAFAAWGGGGDDGVVPGTGAGTDDREETDIITWTYPSDLSDNINPDGVYGRNPRVAMDDNGNAIITWDQDDGNPLNMQVYMSEYR